MRLSISDTGLVLIKRFEGCRLKSYQDSVGVWTIGYGHTTGVVKGQNITQAQADTYLKSDCVNAENTSTIMIIYTTGIKISLMLLLVLLLIVVAEI